MKSPFVIMNVIDLDYPPVVGWNGQWHRMEFEEIMKNATSVMEIHP